MSLVPAHVNFTIYEGATFYRRITLEIDGVAQDLTGYKAELVIKNEPGDSAKLLVLTSPNGGIVLGEKGVLEVTITSTATKSLTWESGVYELFLTDPNERTDVLLTGSFKVMPF